MDQRYPICWWCPMTAIWPFVSPCIIWLSWDKCCVLCYCAVLYWMFSALNYSTEHYLSAPILWPQCHWSLCLRHVPLIEIHPHWYLHPWPLSGGWWRNDLQYCVSALTHLLWSHLALSKEHEKVLQTCSYHLTVAVCFFVPCIFMYIRPAKTSPIDKSFYSIIIPHAELVNLLSKKLWVE